MLDDDAAACDEKAALDELDDETALLLVWDRVPAAGEEGALAEGENDAPLLLLLLVLALACALLLGVRLGPIVVDCGFFSGVEVVGWRW